MTEIDRRSENRRDTDRPASTYRSQLEMDQLLRKINAEVIHKHVPDISIESLEPFFRLVAEARGTYIKSLLAVTSGVDGLPSEEQVNEFALLRRTYDELIHGAQEIETIISRGYIDVKE